MRFKMLNKRHSMASNRECHGESKSGKSRGTSPLNQHYEDRILCSHHTAV